MKIILIFLFVVLLSSACANRALVDIAVEYDGNIRYETPLVGGKKHGIERIYYCENDVCELHSETPFERGKRSGVGTIYSSIDMILKVTYINNLPHGIKRVYNKEGGLIRTVPYVNGKIEGVAKNYENGVLVGETTYKNDKKNGLDWFCYNETCQEITYVDNKIHGTWTINANNGELIIETPYVDNIREGTFKLYQKGVLAGTIQYLNNMMNGSLIIYINAQPAAEFIYSNNILQYGYCYNNTEKRPIKKEALRIWRSVFDGSVDINDLMENFETLYCE